MKRTKQIVIAVILAFSASACNSQSKPDSETKEINSTPIQSTSTMKSYISIFEIPATDISRAIEFYQSILEIKIEQLEFPEMQMGLLPYEDQIVTGIIVQGEGYQPSADGVTLYLNGGNDLQAILDRVVKYGGKVIAPKAALADESGYFALFMDSEGNKMGLHSPN